MSTLPDQHGTIKSFRTPVSELTHSSHYDRRKSGGVFAPLSELLERAGSRIRGRRADCIHCEGHSRLTVSFNNEVAYCHRCKWTGNARTLARELGLPLEPLTREIHEKREQHDRFTEWERTIYLLLMRGWRSLTRRAELAKQVLLRFPDCDPAWRALADFYHSESTFSAAFEFLSCDKLPQYLEAPMTRDKLFAAFTEAERRMRDVA
jgi:hypothetical protein